MAERRERMLGGFRIVEEIPGASGNQGQIFRAVCVESPFPDLSPGAEVALKVMTLRDEEGRLWRQRLQRTSALSRLNHSNVVRYYGCFCQTGDFNDVHVVVQEFLHGETLKDYLERNPGGLDADVAKDIVNGALAGLDYAAEKGFVHRDVKPGNIFLVFDQTGRIASVKLIDFETARQENAVGGTVTGVTGGLVGSFDYMAPDFTEAGFRGDVQSDIFSMGVVMHEVLTGRTPYAQSEGQTTVTQSDYEFFARWANYREGGESPIRTSSRVKRLLAHADEVLARALAPDREKRFKTFAEFREGLKNVKHLELRNGEKSYRILQIIGKGGFGEVFKARQKDTRRPVAIKHLMKSEYEDRFVREAKIMAKLRGDCFVRLVDFFEVDRGVNRQAFLVMDYLPGMPGSSLRDAIKRKGSLDPLTVLKAFIRYAHGLAEMHDGQVIHRDIKPANLYFPEVQPEGARIMDLGIARDKKGTETVGQVPGTLDYMPPEVVMAESRGEPGMDVYALGLCLYEALSGRTAFPRLPMGKAAYQLFFERAKLKPRPNLSASVVTSNPALHQLLVDMTQPEAGDRLANAHVLETRLIKLAEQLDPSVDPITLTRPVPVPDIVSFDEKNRKTELTDVVHDKPGPPVIEIPRQATPPPPKGTGMVWICVGALLAVGLFGGAWWGWQWRNGQREQIEIRRVVDAVEHGWSKRTNDYVRTDGAFALAVSEETLKEMWEELRQDWLSHPRCPRNVRERVEQERREWLAARHELRERLAHERRAKEMADYGAAAEAIISAYGDATQVVTQCDQRADKWRKDRPTSVDDVFFGELDDRLRNARDARVKNDAELARLKLLEEARVSSQRILDACKTDGKVDETVVKAFDAETEEWTRVWKERLAREEATFAVIAQRFADARAKLIEGLARREAVAARAAAEPVLKDYAATNRVALADCDARAEAWKREWQPKLAADVVTFNAVVSEFDGARARRVDYLKWLKLKKLEDEARSVAADVVKRIAATAETNAATELAGDWRKDRKDFEEKGLADSALKVLDATIDQSVKEAFARIQLERLEKATHARVERTVKELGGTKSDAEVDAVVASWREAKGRLIANGLPEKRLEVYDGQVVSASSSARRRIQDEAERLRREQLKQLGNAARQKAFDVTNRLARVGAKAEVLAVVGDWNKTKADLAAKGVDASLVGGLDKLVGDAKASADQKLRRAAVIAGIRDAIEDVTEHVEGWRERLAEAAAKLDQAVTEGIVEGETAAELQRQIDVRREKWFVGRVENRFGKTIRVGNREIAPSRSEVFIFTNGIPQDAVTCAGHVPLQIDRRAFDGRTLTVDRLERLPVAVLLPELDAQATCRVLRGTEELKGQAFSLSPGTRLEIRYAHGAREDGIQVWADQRADYTVTDEAQQRLPKPGEWRHTPEYESHLKQLAQAERERKIAGVTNEFARLLALHPIAERRKRLAAAERLLDGNRTLLDATAKELARRLDDERLRVAGIVENKTPLSLTVTGGTQIGPGRTAEIDWPKGVPQGASISIRHYRDVPIPPDFDGATFTVTPQELKPLPVRVAIPAHDQDVVCEIDGDATSEAFAELEPGNHAVVWRKVDCADQRLVFAVKARTPGTVPAFDSEKWVPNAALKALDRAWADYNDGELNSLDDYPGCRDVKGTVARQRLAAIEAYQRVRESVEKARFRHENQDWRECLVFYVQACNAGWIPTDDDSDRAQEAYEARLADLNKILNDTIPEDERMHRSPRYIREKIQQEKAELLTQWETITNACRKGRAK